MSMMPRRGRCALCGYDWGRASQDCSAAIGSSDAKVGNELCAILSHYAAERGESEGAVETLERLLREAGRTKHLEARS